MLGVCMCVCAGIICMYVSVIIKYYLQCRHPVKK